MSEEKSKGFSLRKKGSRRPPISSPRSIKDPAAPQALSHSQAHNQSNHATGGAGSSLEVPRERPRLGGNTSDLVKRRYSTRFTQLPDFSNAGAPPLPALPVAPNQNTRKGPPRGVPAASQSVSVNVNVLRDPELQAEKCETGQLLSQGLGSLTGAGRHHRSALGCFRA